ncbi:hypothetical protein PHYPO_G00023430 [Pangasianodon hypophthalmus]|uniref:Uncharacterized protein n=1 Tax=Pangasianodon hypophthalmus TaxID=310915 RepID=A0A5N5MXE9_PANHP|nr:hypothetical protein PHYPO_G00023430 [Pangasianodon hypophthalmus]
MAVKPMTSVRFAQSATPGSTCTSRVVYVCVLQASRQSPTLSFGPRMSHLDTLTGTCQHQNQIQRESPDAGLFPSRGSASSSILNLEISSSLPATVAVLCCAFIAATFVVVFGLLQFRSYSLTKVCSSEASVGSVMRASFGLGMARSGVISYKGIPSVWNEDGGNSESENDEFDIHNERTAFIKTQSAL